MKGDGYVARKTPRICYACGKNYQYCPNCAEDENKPKWLFAFHDETCKTVFETLTRYCGKDISAEEAYQLLKDIIKEEDFSQYTKNIQKDLNVIFASAKPISKAPRKKSVKVD